MWIYSSMFRHRYINRTGVTLSALLTAVLFLPTVAGAQGFGPVMSTVGTTIEDGAGRDWNYLLWQTDGPLPFPGGHLAIYRKNGPSDSADPYVRQAIVQRQVEGPTIRSLINRSLNLGEDPVALDGTLDAMFQEIMPANAVTLSDKVSAAVRGALNDPNQWDNLLLLARSHPSIAMCLGVGFAEVVPSSATLTYEVREWNAVDGVDLEVVGRVTIQSGNPVVLPAPGTPVVVPEEDPRGDLNVKLRWATPNSLRRLSPLHFGYNVIRMTRGYAESQNLHITPPSPEQLKEMLGSVPEVVEVNRVPVLVPRDFTQAEVVDFTPGTGFPDVYFTHDDNRRFDENGVPLVNGDEFYYFIAARDLLGRNGFVSPGTLAVICDRLPPPTPRRVVVANAYQSEAGTQQQRLKVSWQQNDNGGVEQTMRYYIYRWDGPAEMNALAGNPASKRIAIVNHLNGLETGEYVDDGAGAPLAATDAGRTFYYTVRAVDDGACGGNVSGNSAPKFGVLRDRAGPAAPGGRIEELCLLPVVEQTNVEYLGRNPNGGLLYLLRITRLDPRILWVEFYRGTLDANGRIARTYFPSGQNTVDEIVELPSGTSGEALIFYCQVGTSRGTESNILIANNPGGTPTGSEVRIINFEARLDQSTPGTSKNCDGRFDPLGPTAGGGVSPVNPVTGTVFLTPGTKSYRVYRRIDGGALTLVEQGEADFDDVTTVVYTDPNIPAQYAEVCYYAQLFDEHGNASPMRLLGCVEVIGTQPLPVPMLSKVEPEGDEANPKMRLRWFSPPYGVEQFEIWMAAGADLLPVKISDQLTTNLVAHPNLYPLIDNGETNELDFSVHRTTRVGGSQLGGGPEFISVADVELGREYTIMVRAVGRDGSLGNFSNVGQFVWHPKLLEGPQVPWPARSLPLVNTNFSSVIIAGIDTSTYDGIMVRIGVFITTEGNIKRPYFIPNPTFRPMDWLAKEAGTGENLFPVVMYRYQVPNVRYPKVSGDLVQVTPLMEDIAIQVQQEGVRMLDAYIYARATQATDNIALGELFLADTHPSLRGARYRYLLVRLKPNGEIDQVIPTNEVEVAL